MLSAFPSHIVSTVTDTGNTNIPLPWIKTFCLVYMSFEILHVINFGEFVAMLEGESRCGRVNFKYEFVSSSWLIKSQ